ncbi:hypothetical protein Barb6_03482 [Bacteroidales bacterium Barb6]|nr:hypothetical protein Barb6_03482 [Bacteroidales bacterium Barb6]
MFLLWFVADKIGINGHCWIAVFPFLEIPVLPLNFIWPGITYRLPDIVKEPEAVCFAQYCHCGNQSQTFYFGSPVSLFL